jgi:D-alanyl-D-alanine dipeptidase
VKPYRTIPISECGEPLVPIPPERFDLPAPHAYQSLNAPYGSASPYSLRAGVLERLLKVALRLEQLRPGFRLRIHDAYRPIPVQRFMIEHAVHQLASARGYAPESMTEEERARVLYEVLAFWASPSEDPATPPPHSTGAALDVTLLDGDGRLVQMGSEVDEISERSRPDHFAGSALTSEAQYHEHRETLRQVMSAGGFLRHPEEWWHFSFGDQLWAWSRRQSGDPAAVAIYGRVDAPESPEFDADGGLTRRVDA